MKALSQAFLRMTAVALCIAVAGGPGAARDDVAMLSGRVADSGGRPLAGAQVSVAADGVGPAGALTGRDGVYRFPALKPLRHYSLTAARPGFRSITYDGMYLEQGGRRVVDFRLKRPGEREVVVLGGRDPYPYEDLVRAFVRGLDVPVRVIDLDAEANPYETVRRIRAERPDVILGAGVRAALQIRHAVPDVPSILTLLPDSRRYDLVVPNLCFLETNPAGEETLRRLTALLPWVKRIGVVYDSSGSSLVARDLRAAADRLDLALELRPCYDARDLEKHLDSLRGRIDLLVVPYDQLTTSPQVLGRVTDWALRQGIALAGPTPEWPGHGALLSYGPALDGMGREAAVIASGILSLNRQPSDIALVFPATSVPLVNRGTARALGLTIPPETDVLWIE